MSGGRVIRVGVLVLLGLAVLCAGADGAWAAANKRKAWVVTDGRVRVKPGARAATVEKVDRGTEIVLLGPKEGRWLRVQVGRRSGWVVRELLTFRDPGDEKAEEYEDDEEDNDGADEADGGDNEAEAEAEADDEEEEARAEKSRAVKARAEKEKDKVRLEKARLAKERLEKERLAKEQLEKERLEAERHESARVEKARLERARLEKERLAKARVEKERAARRDEDDADTDDEDTDENADEDEADAETEAARRARLAKAPLFPADDEEDPFAPKGASRAARSDGEGARESSGGSDADVAVRGGATRSVPSSWTVLLGAGAGYRSASVVFDSDGAGGLARYRLRNQGIATKVDGRLLRRLGRYVLVGAEVRYGLITSSSFRFLPEGGEGGVIPFTRHEVEADGLVAYAPPGGGLVLSARVGERLQLLRVPQDDNPARLPGETTRGFEVGGRLQLPRVVGAITLGVGADVLLGGSVKQTQGLEDGTDSSVSSLVGLLEASRPLGASFTLDAAYRYGRSDVTFSGVAPRQTDVTSATCQDREHELLLGLTRTFR